MSDIKSPEPFIPFTARLIHRESDDEYVAKLTKYLERWEYWRRGFVIFFVGTLLAVIGLIFYMSMALEIIFRNMQNQAPNFVVFGLIVGAAFGYIIGQLIHTSVHGIIFGLGGFRTERLLIKHYHSGHSEVE